MIDWNMKDAFLTSGFTLCMIGFWNAGHEGIMRGGYWYILSWFSFILAIICLNAIISYVELRFKQTLENGFTIDMT